MLLDLDRWILHRFEEVRARVVKAYEDYEFHPSSTTCSISSPST